MTSRSLPLSRPGAGVFGWSGLRSARAAFVAPPATLARHGALELKIATTRKEVRGAQRLRYEVFYEEGGALAGAAARLLGRDICRFDRFCDHLIVIDHAARGKSGVIKPRVVGCYRLLRQESAEAIGGFYSAREFDLAPLLAARRGARLLELGRSCVHRDYRDRIVLEMLWRGLWLYARHHAIDAMIGCASFPGTDARAHASAISFLRQSAPAREDFTAAARPERRAAIEGDIAPLSPRRALTALPPLIKGYLRVGARFGEGAVVDRQFRCTDVFVVLRMADIEPRWIDHIVGAPARAA